jgi:hypothetical protein
VQQSANFPALSRALKTVTVQEETLMLQIELRPAEIGQFEKYRDEIIKTLRQLTGKSWYFEQKAPTQSANEAAPPRNVALTLSEKWRMLRQQNKLAEELSKRFNLEL